MDVLLAENNSLWFYERLPGDAFEKHKLMTNLSIWDGFEVADWDGDRQLFDSYFFLRKRVRFLFYHRRKFKIVCSIHFLLQIFPLSFAGDMKLDILMCTVELVWAEVRFLSHSVVLAGVTNMYEHPAILWTHGTECEMQAVDFDEDGDLDLVMGKGYFERVLDELEERTGEQNPLQAFPGQVDRIADLDGDGRLDVLVAVTNSAETNSAEKTRRWRYFRRAAAGTFVEPWENPLAEMQFGDIFSLRSFFVSHKIHVADWNSDGLPDVLLVGTRVWSYYQHVVDRDLRRNSHFKMYEDIHLSHPSSFVVQDWNEDGFEDVMVVQQQSSRESGLVWKLRRYEFQPRHMKEVLGFSLNVNSTVVSAYDLSGFALVDWDRDGALDLLIASEIDGKLHFYPNLGEESAEHPFKNIQLKKQPHPDRTIWMFAKPMVVDWDNDGDLDLFLGPPDGRYFEHLADGSLREKQSPLVRWQSLPSNSYRRRQPVYARNWQFVDCDADGDLDLIQIHQIPDSNAPAQACEHDDSTHELRCDPDFLCLGTDISQYQGGAADGGSFFSVLDGQLKLFVQRPNFFWEGGIELWTPGFCVPSDLCNNKGHCLPGESHCRCNLGHEAADCSSCHEHYYSVHRQELQVQDCKACPGDVAGGKVCYGRGTCFDDAMAKSLQQESTAAWMSIGNGSCNCTEAHFYGTDQDGRSACMDGHCPAGTEEVDGNCNSCAGGSFSAAGGLCQECGAGKFSRRGSTNCSSCAAGRVSKTSGSSTCEPCRAGTYESENQFCNACPRGTISKEGSAACSPCEAGRFTRESRTCEQCPGGMISVNGSSECRSCPAGKYSRAGSSSCSKCPAGAISQVAGSSACEACRAGTYEINRQVCNTCPQGKISAVAGSAACSPCDAGRFAKEALMCEQCPNGTISSAGRSECQSCPSGTFSHPESNGCSECPAGTISKVPGSTECWQCAAGTFSAAGSSECRNCPAGQFSEAGSSSCSKCPAGEISKDPGSIACEACPAGTHEVDKQFCNLCQQGTISAAGSGTCSPCDAGRFAKDALTCEPCKGGTFAGPNSSSCENCGLGEVSLPNSATCRNCNDLLVRAVPDATGQTCEVEAMDIVLGLICWMTSACFCFLFLTGCFGRFPISDVSSQGDKVVITTSIAHYFLKRAHPVVSFTGTGVPNLDSTSTWKVRALSSYQFTLHGEQASIPLDTSKGHIRLNFPHPFLCMGMWRCPLLGWCLFFATATVTAGVAGRLVFSLTALACGFGFCTGLLAFAFRRRQGFFRRRRSGSFGVEETIHDIAPRTSHSHPKSFLNQT